MVFRRATVTLLVVTAVIVGTAGFALRRIAQSSPAAGATPAPSVPRSMAASADAPIARPEPPVPAEPILTMAVFGDLMLDRNVRFVVRDKGLEWIFEPSAWLYQWADATVANLEGTVTDNRSVAKPNLLRFTFDPALMARLKRIGFTHVSLANNHHNDFGEDGRAQTAANLDAAGITHFGEYFNGDGKLSTLVKANGVTVALVGWNEFSGVNWNGTLEEIRRLDVVADAVVVMPHWSQEYRREPTPGQRRLARAFIDAGADAVLGGHPHVVQPLEIYRNRPVFYSLGNFVFDQFFSKETQQGLGLAITFRKGGATFQLLPLSMHEVQVGVAPAVEREGMLSWIAEHSLVPEDVRAAVASGQFSVTFSE